MLGLALATLYVGWKYLMNGDAPLEPAFLSAARFLYGWYWGWAIGGGIFIGAVALLVVPAMTANGARAGGTAGGLVGFILGGGISTLLIVGFAVRNGLLLVGSYLLMHAGRPDQTFAEFTTKNLVIGAVLIAVGLLAFRSKSETKSESK